MILYRAEATRRHKGRATTWRGKVTDDPARALAQAQRWRMKEPFGNEYYVVTIPGDKKVSLEDLEAFVRAR